MGYVCCLPFSSIILENNAGPFDNSLIYARISLKTTLSLLDRTSIENGRCCFTPL